MTSIERPVVAGLPAKACEKPDCIFCKTTFATAFTAWICPHCNAHLSTNGTCLNLCGLAAETKKRINELLNEVAEKVSKRR